MTSRYYSKRVRNDALSCRNINEKKENPEKCNAPTPPNCNPVPPKQVFPTFLNFPFSFNWIFILNLILLGK